MARPWPRSPQAVFLFFATIMGLALIFLVPPLGGGNETLNFQRVATIAAGHVLIEPAAVPGGTVRLLRAANAQFPEGAQAPYGYSWRQWQALADIPLDAATPATLEPNPIAVLHPFCYLPQLAVYWLGAAAGLPPLWLFLLGRGAGLLAGIGLTFVAIRRMPFHGAVLAALALLPTISFSRSTLDADQLTNGLAFFFVATVLREIVELAPIRRRTLVELAVTAFVLAQCKSAYLVLPFLVLAIPASRFANMAQKALACALIILPGLLAALAWMIALKLTFFTGLRYRTWAGEVYPDMQSTAVLHDPFGYAIVLARSLFTTPLIPDSFIGLIGIFGPPVYMPLAYYMLLPLAFAGVALADEQRRAVVLPLAMRALAIGILFAGLGLILTLLYVQWTGLGGPVIRGFQGRYLYPLLPLMFIFLPRAGRPFLGFGAPAWLSALGAISLVGTLFVTWSTYLAAA